jgi:hypothetical protein
VAAQVRVAYRFGRIRVHRPCITEPGMWLLCRFLHNNHYAERSIMPMLVTSDGRSADQRRCDVVLMSA